MSPSPRKILVVIVIYLNRDTHNLVNKLGIFKIQPETPMNFLNEPDEFYDFAKLFIFLIKLAYLSSSLTW